MSLSGNLGFVSLDEVLRLLIRSGQRGCVSVRGDQVDGRVFVTRGGISLATTTTDDGLEVLFRKSQMVDPAQIAADKLETGDGDVIELIREITVESIYRLNLHGVSFDVAEGVEARYGSPRPFDLEQTLEASRKRLEDWAEVSQVVSDLDARIAFLRDLGDREEVKIRRDAWKVLSEVGAGASVTEIARELGTTEFWAARVVARLVQDDLLKAQPERIEPADQTWESAEPDYQPESDAVTQRVAAEVSQHDFREDETAEPEYDYSLSQDVAGEEPAVYGEGAPDDGSESYEPATEPESVWQTESQIPGVGAEVEEPVQDVQVEEPVDATPEETAGEPAEEFDHDSSWWEEPEDEAAGPEDGGDEADGDVEEDTEAFLEKVFSELDRSDEGEEEGYGLLRRRRLGAMRDIARDS